MRKPLLILLTFCLSISVGFSQSLSSDSLHSKVNDSPARMKAEWSSSMNYFMQGNIDSSYYFAKKNIPVLRQQNNAPLLLRYLFLQGNCLMRLDRTAEAMQDFYEALGLAEESGDQLSRMKAHTNIAFGFMALNQQRKAIGELRQALSIIELAGLPPNAIVYNNLAASYGAIGMLDSSKFFASRSVDLAKRSGDKTAEANALNILGSAYQDGKDYQRALTTFLQSSVIRKNIGDPYFIVSDMSTIASLYSQMGKPNLGIKTAEEALKIAMENKLTSKLPLVYESLALNYTAAGRDKDAAAVYRELNILKDSLYADASPEALAEIQTKYETEKKERMIRDQDYQLKLRNYTISQNNSKIKYQRLLIIGACIALLFLILLGVTQYRRYRWKQEAKARAAVLRQQELSTKAVLEAEEGERQRIAKDLHDGIGQTMSAAKMNLSAFEHSAYFKSDDERAAFARIIALVDESCKELRTVSHNMMPNALLKNNLAAAIREFINKLDQKKLKVQLYTEGLDERLHNNIETILYRVVQECVNNVIKHSNADNLDISIIREENQISATIEDNGQGFNSDDPNIHNGIGLKNIQTRIAFLKGTVDFHSTLGRGTLVALHIPV